MKQRILSIVVTNGKGDVIFKKNPCSPQDVMSALPLFEGDDVVYEVRMTSVDLPDVKQK